MKNMIGVCICHQHCGTGLLELWIRGMRSSCGRNFIQAILVVVEVIDSTIFILGGRLNDGISLPTVSQMSGSMQACI